MAIQLARQDPDLRGVRVLVVGLGKSGLAAIRLATAKGARVNVADLRVEQALGDAFAGAQQLCERVIAGGYEPTLADEHDLIVISPGVPLDQDLLLRAQELDVPIWGEVELAARFCRGRIVGVTGSNGKSTVTSLVGEILRRHGFPGGTGGNLDTPFSDLLQHDAPDAVHAVELSSFQLETIRTLAPAVAVLLNISPDHLDRYRTYHDYAQAKSRIFRFQSPDDAAIVNHDNADSRGQRHAITARLFEFSTRRRVRHGAFVKEGRMVLRTDEGRDELLAVDELPLVGEHNHGNALAAALACRLVGCSPAAIAEGLRGYRPLRHRLQHVRTVAGVDYYNDSKATNLEAAERAVRAFPGRRIHWIAGGRDKGTDWTRLPERLLDDVATMLLIGEAAGQIGRALEDAVKTVACGDLPGALRTAIEHARPGDVVLLAPACASFDQYRNFEERGDHFVRLVEALAGDDGEAGDA